MIGVPSLNIEEDSAQTQVMNTNVMYDHLKPRSHRRPQELAVSQKLEVTWFLALMTAVSMLVGILLTFSYLFTWVAFTAGQGGVAPGFWVLMGAFGAICTVGLAVLAILYLVERSRNAPWS